MIETYFNNLMQEVERKMGIESSRMEGEQVIRTCQGDGFFFEGAIP
ncbi:hypothetical protein NXW49_14685 [Bacteroides thetaiotaomicron]|nr:hypothetical protein [Bacteroides thetaiotaomicron]